MVCLALPFAAGANLVANPGFDTGAAYSIAPTGSPVTWAPASGNPWFIKQEDLDKGYVTWGLSSARYVSPSYSSYGQGGPNAMPGGGTFISLRQNNIVLSPGITYKLSFNYWSAGAGWIGTTAGANVQVFIVEFDGAGNVSWPNTFTIADAGGMWLPYTQQFTTQSGTVKILLKFQYAATTPSSDRLFIDNVNISAVPQVTITSPTADAVYETSASTIDIAGTASASGPAITSVTWSNSTGGSGTCTGTTSWSANGIALHDGDDVITVTVTDAAGTTNTDSLMVVPPLPVGPVITDNFNRVVASTDPLGTTAAPNSYPWTRGIYNGVIDPRVSIDGTKMILGTGPNCWSGVFIDSLLMRDFDATFTISSAYVGDADWTAIQYRGMKPMYAEYVTGNDTAGDPAAYLLKIYSRSYTGTTKYRLQIESSATGALAGVDTNIDFASPHTVRLKVVGNQHQVWVDTLTGTPLLAVANGNNLGVGYFEVCRRDSPTTVDNLSIQLHDAYGTVTGTVRDSSTNAVIAGAEVTVLGKTATTDSNGVYTISGLVSGSWQMNVFADGYAVSTKTTTVVANGSTTEDVSLTPLPAIDIYDTFTRDDSTELGQTEDAGHYPWVNADPNSGTGIAYEAMSIPEGGNAGVGLGGGMFAADFSLSCTFCCGAFSTGYAGIAYRCLAAGTEDASAYSLRIDTTTYENVLTLVGHGVNLATVTLPVSYDFFNYPGQNLQIRAQGNRHRVWVNGTLFIDYTDTSQAARATGGYINVIHNPSWAVMDDFELTAWGNTLSGGLTGQVTCGGVPVADAEVAIDGGTYVTTDASGVYTISGYIPGGHVAIASKPGYTSSRAAVTVPSGSSVTQNFELAALAAGIYYDTFTRADDAVAGVTEDASHTPWVEFGADQLSVTSHRLEVAVGGPTYANASLGIQARNFEISFDTTLLTTTNAFVGLMYRNPSYGDDSHSAGGYLVEFNPSRIYLWSELTGHIQGPDNTFALGVPHTIKIRVEDDRHRCWIDDTLMWDITNSANTNPGYFCLMRAFGAATWDNFRLEVLDPPAFVPAANVSAVKALGAGQQVSLQEAVITGKMSGYGFYVEDADRSSGIKVMGTPTQGVGDKVKVNGTTSLVDGELVITIGSAADVTLVSTGSAVDPLVVNGRGLGTGAGLSAIGLLVKVAGKVTAVDSVGRLITIDDGSGVSYRAWCHDTITLPAVDDIVICRGCAGRLGGLPVVWMFNGTDLRKVGP